MNSPRPPAYATQPDAAAEKLKAGCQWFLSGDGPEDIAATLRALADFSEFTKVQPDYYGTGALLQDFEREMAQLLGFPAGLFFPSGTMAQQIALRIWCDHAGSPSVAFHPTCHLEMNEHQAYQHLHGLEAALIGTPEGTVLAQDILAMKKIPAAVLVELPQRRSGGALPTWEELNELKAMAREKGIKLHLDGARLWETQTYYAKSLAEICAGFDSAYISFYKGVNAITGAMLLGPESFIDEARIWQRRMGGNLYHLYPYVLSAKMMLEKKLPRFRLYHEMAVALGEELSKIPGLRIIPEIPRASMMHVYCEISPERFREIRNLIAAEDRIWLGAPMPAAEGLHSKIEISVGEATLDCGLERIGKVFRKLVQATGSLPRQDL